MESLPNYDYWKLQSPKENQNQFENLIGETITITFYGGKTKKGILIDYDEITIVLDEQAYYILDITRVVKSEID